MTDPSPEFEEFLDKIKSLFITKQLQMGHSKRAGSQPKKGKMTPTAARPTSTGAGHWYSIDGQPAYEVAKKDKSGMRKTTLADARKLNLIPSVTTILKILHKEALQNWLIEQSVLAVVTAPRLPGEKDDAFIERVIHTERQQDQEAGIARDKGTEIHDAIETYFLGITVSEPIKPWIMPAARALEIYGAVVATEKNLVGPGFAGRNDLILECAECWWLWDYKSTKKLPDPKKGGAWSEHKLQLSGYAKAFHRLLKSAGGQDKPIRTGNVYISSLTAGEFVICEHEEDWQDTYELGFRPLVTHWQWANQYVPAQKKDVEETKPAPAPEPQAVEEPPVDTVPEPAAAPALPVTKDGKKIVWTEGKRL